MSNITWMLEMTLIEGLVGQRMEGWYLQSFCVVKCFSKIIGGKLEY